MSATGWRLGVASKHGLRPDHARVATFHLGRRLSLTTLSTLINDSVSDWRVRSIQSIKQGWLVFSVPANKRAGAYAKSSSKADRLRADPASPQVVLFTDTSAVATKSFKQDGRVLS